MSKATSIDQREADIRSLLALVNSSVEDAIAAWKEKGGVPGLGDAPAGDKSPSPALLRAIRVLDSASQQMTFLLRPTFLNLTNVAFMPIEAAALRTATEAKIADFLDGKPKGAHVDEIAKKTGLPPFELACILRCLTMKHIFREVSKDVFGNNRGSYVLRSVDPNSAFVGFMLGEASSLGLANMYEALHDPEYGPSLESKRSVFSYNIRKEYPNTALFDWYLKHPEQHERFNRAMTAVNLANVSDFYPVASLPPDTTWCDIGGGIGGPLAKVAGANPKLRLTLQDLPNVIERGKEQGRFNFVPIDFTEEAPVEGQDIYYMRFIVHDWPDDVATVILKNIRKAMKPSSRLLVHDLVLPTPSDGSTAGGTKNSAMNSMDAPPPLLPNYGAGGILPLALDINVMALLNAKERSIDDVVQLAKQADMKFVQFWDGVESGVIELGPMH
ncbi:hypothetical protein EWM64_g1255 [Hericium alpestre]|uniref:O-methyltransferase C-terminal domain-containing protein n=1 Tax=Hericium alpestre TaxID=135208 RepID=A0A4Z0A6U7_9AGAM|nr:hypothetical protein EWM64_g1255 [Hericium alpestre]